MIRIINLISHPKFKIFRNNIADKNGIDINNNIDRLFNNN